TEPPSILTNVNLPIVLCPIFFFFQAEDGIRDRNVTGVQTCALPISSPVSDLGTPYDPETGDGNVGRNYCLHITPSVTGFFDKERSEERRVGKECTSGWTTYAC